jgi:hypothetical protein
MPTSDNSPFPFQRKKRPPPNRCWHCGKIVGEQFAGYSKDRLDKGPFLCSACERKLAEAVQP